jgi:class 3 adenylate cyclase
MHNGYVQTYIGDALMPIFENASDAVKGAIDMRFALREFNDHVMKNPEYTSKGLRFLRTGIGIATGETRHGITGTENRMQETVLGDSVNTGSRLEGLTKMYRVPIIIDGNTCDDLAMQGMIANPLEEGSLNQILSGEKILVRELDVVKPKGKNQELTIYEVIPRSYNREVLERRIGMNDLYSEAILLSRGKNPNTRSVRDSLNEAREIFSRISSAYPAGMGRKIAGMEEDQGGDYVCEQKIKELDELILRTETEPALFKKNGWYVKVFNGK